MAVKQVTHCLVMLVLFSILVVHVSAIPLNRRKSLNKIKEVNSKGPYIGLITVYPPEENAFFATEAFKPHPKHPFVDLSGRRFMVGKIHGKKVIYVRCGVGMVFSKRSRIPPAPKDISATNKERYPVEVNAAAATQQMLDLFEIMGILHFGIAGNVNNSMSIGDVTIPKQFAHTGIWDWLNPNRTLNPSDIAQLDFGNFNVPKGEEINQLGHIGYSYEQFFSESGKPNTAQPLVWAQVTQHWLHLAANLEGCVNSSLCLPYKPKLVIGLRGSTANIFVDNAAYRDFLFQTFGVSSVDMESAAVVMTSLSNGFPVIVIRGLSDLAGGQPGQNPIEIFGPLAALNAAKAVVQFIDKLPEDASLD